MWLHFVYHYLEKWQTYTSKEKKCQYTISNFQAASYDDAKSKCNTIQSSLAILKSDIQSILPVGNFYFVGLTKSQFWAWKDNSNFTGQFVTGRSVYYVLNYVKEYFKIKKTATVLNYIIFRFRLLWAVKLNFLSTNHMYFQWSLCLRKRYKSNKQ